MHYHSLVPYLLLIIYLIIIRHRCHCPRSHLLVHNNHSLNILSLMVTSYQKLYLLLILFLLIFFNITFVLYIFLSSCHIHYLNLYNLLCKILSILMYIGLDLHMPNNYFLVLYNMDDYLLYMNIYNLYLM